MIEIMKRIIVCFFAVSCIYMFSSCGGGNRSNSGAAAVAENEVDIAQKLWTELDLATSLNTLAAKEQQAGWQLLFDGATFNGWHGYNTPGSIPEDWAIEDACLTANGTGGGESHDIITDGIYRNFAFTVEYSIMVGANSGIIYHVKEDPKYTFPYETGPEFQLNDDSNRPEERRLQGVQSHGANYGMYAPSSHPYKLSGEWNRLMLICKDNEVIHIINGVEVVRFVKYSDEWNELRNSGKWSDFPDYGKFDEGNISLQNHGSKLFFRNIKIKQL